MAWTLNWLFPNYNVSVSGMIQVATTQMENCSNWNAHFRLQINSSEFVRGEKSQALHIVKVVVKFTKKWNRAVSLI
jgi:hypothetical protein